MLSLDVIVEQHESTSWVSSITIVKKTGKLRVCLDPTKLNHTILREPYPATTIEEVIAKTANARYFSVRDVRQDIGRCN